MLTGCLSVWRVCVSIKGGRADGRRVPKVRERDQFDWQWNINDLQGLLIAAVCSPALRLQPPARPPTILGKRQEHRNHRPLAGPGGHRAGIYNVIGIIDASTRWRGLVSIVWPKSISTIAPPSKHNVHSLAFFFFSFLTTKRRKKKEEGKGPSYRHKSPFLSLSSDVLLAHCTMKQKSDDRPRLWFVFDPHTHNIKE